MATEPFRSLLVVGGTGELGLRLTIALLKDQRLQVSVFTRPVRQTRRSSKSEKERILDQLSRDGATIIRGSLSDLDALTATLRGFDVVVSVLGYDVLQHQATLVQAARAAGVKRFVPSEWGGDTPRYLREGKATGTCCFTDEASKILQAVYDSGMDYTVFLTGVFYETTFTPLFWWDLAAGKVTIKGDPDKPFSATSEDDIARWVPDILMDPASRNQIVRLEGQQLTWNQAVEIFEHAQGRKLDVTYRTLAELKAEVTAATDPCQVSMQQFTLLLNEGYSTNDDTWFSRPNLNRSLYRNETLQPPLSLADFAAARK